MKNIFKNEKALGVFFSLPAMIVMTILTLYPVFYAIYLSLHKVIVGMQIKIVFVGLLNYISSLKDFIFSAAFINTLEFVIGATTLEVSLGLLFALILMWEFRGRRYIVPLVVLPMMLPTIVICSFWRIIYHPEFGILNAILRFIGVSPINWLGDPRIAMLSIVLVDVWQYTPFTFLIILAGILSIPKDILDAAEVDGASKIQQIKYIIIPSIRGQILIVALLRIIDTFRVFDKVYALTGGGPGISTETLTLVIYNNAFRYYKFGYGSAQAIIMLITVLIIIAIYIRVTLKKGWTS